MVKFSPLPASEPGVYIVNDKVKTLESSSDQTMLTGQPAESNPVSTVGFTGILLSSGGSKSSGKVNTSRNKKPRQLSKG